MKVNNYLQLIITVLLCGSFAFAASLTPDELIHEVDAHRLISDSFEMTIRVNNYIKDQYEGSTVMNGHIENGRMTMLTFLEPMNMKGRKIIINGDDMRLIIPNVKNPIRITDSQRLVGGISYGDVAAIGYEDGYTPEVIGEDTVTGINSDGTKSEPVQCFVLQLTAKEIRASYHKIILWVEKQNHFPIKGDFFARSGKKMTTVYYTAPIGWNGKNIVGKMYLYDQINTGKYFSMEYSDFKVTSKNENP